MPDDTLPTPAPDAPAVIAGRYELVTVIGRGGTADVYRARDLRLDRDVAVKLFPRGVTGPDQRRQDAELETLSRLRHPGLIELFDAGSDDGRAYLVMQLVPGPPLSERLQAGALAEESVVVLGAQLADTLAYVHSNGITHRDVKPANVLLGDDDRPMLGDFGIARLVDTTRVTATGYLIGTAAYMAPEQVRGAPVGPATDIYALGLVLLEAVTGRREYPGAMMESLTARLHRPPEVPEDLADGLTPLLQRMTATDPAYRPSAADVATALRTGSGGGVGGGGGGTALLPAPPVDATQQWDATQRIGTGAGAGAAGATVVTPPTAPRPARPTGSARQRRGLLPLLVAALVVASGAAFLWSVLLTDDEAAPPPPQPSRIAPVTPTPSDGFTSEPEPEQEPAPAPAPAPEPAPTPTPQPSQAPPAGTPQPTPAPTPTPEAEPEPAPTEAPSIPEPTEAPTSP